MLDSFERNVYICTGSFFSFSSAAFDLGEKGFLQTHVADLYIEELDLTKLQLQNYSRFLLHLMLLM